MRNPIAIGLLSLSVGCAAEPRPPEDPIARFDLRAAMNSANVTPIGLAIDADGTRYIFDEQAGLLRVDGDSVVSVVAMNEMPNPGPTAPIKPPFTDIIAFAPNVFAITALNDGYLLDTQAMTLTQHFCYLPEGGGGAPVISEQRTDAIAYDAAANRIYAQPISRDAVGSFIKADIAMYDATTGMDLEWNPVSGDTAATAMMIASAGDLILGQDSRLSRWTHRSTPSPIEDLARFGVLSIDGMVIDHATNTLIVVDKAADAVFDIDLAKLDETLE